MARFWIQVWLTDFTTKKRETGGTMSKYHNKCIVRHAINDITLHQPIMSITASRVLLSHKTSPRQLLKVARSTPLAPWVARRLLTKRDASQVIRELSSNTASSLGVEREGFPVDVVEVVALEVVADIPWGTGAGEDAGGGDAELEEGNIIRGSAESTVVCWLARKYPSFGEGFTYPYQASLPFSER
jgi:hypothetical protein